MVVKGSVKVKGGPRAQIRELKRATKDGLKEVGGWWHTNRLPIHFTEKAYTIWSRTYKKRTKKHEDKKRKIYGHNNPNVFSGESEDQITTRAQLTGTAKSVKVKMKAPRYFFMSPPGHPKKKEEVTATTKQEERTMGKRLELFTSERLNKVTESYEEVF